MFGSLLGTKARYKNKRGFKLAKLLKLVDQKLKK
jgi:hypothetical protein